MENMNVYVSALQDSLRRKLDVLERLLNLTKEQEGILAEKSPDMDRFNSIIGEKEHLLGTMQTLDRGFESVFSKIGDALKAERYQYQSEIIQMQNLIRSITDTGLQIEGLEQRNKKTFEQYLIKERQEIKGFHVNHKTANSYYQNMANQHQAWQSYFVDQKK